MRATELALLLLTIPLLSAANVIHVDTAGGGDYLTIQDGVDAASQGDTVLVSPGTYSGAGNHDLDFAGTNIVLRSEAGAAATIIDCQPEFDAFYLHTGEDTTSFIGGFTVLGGGGLTFTGASAVVGGCILEGSTNGVVFTESHSIFRSVEFHGASAGCYDNFRVRFVDCLFEDSGGIYTESYGLESLLEVRRTDFIRCQKGNHGGGIWCQSNEVVLEDVLFQACDLWSPYGGIGFAFCAEYCLATLNRVRVTDTDERGYGVIAFIGTAADLNEVVMWNNTGSYRGTVYFDGYSENPITIANSTIANNGYSGGIYLSDGCSALIQRTIIAYDYVNPIRCPAYGPAPQVDQCCFFECGEDDTLCWDFVGNLNELPLFCDLEGGDLTLHDDSPCLPENNPWGVLIGAYDAGGCGTGVDDSTVGTASLRLLAPSPSPGGGPVNLPYITPHSGEPVEFTIYSASGALVRRLTDVPVSAGRHAAAWDGRDMAGEKVASGVYFVRCRAAGETDRARLVILR